MQTLTWRFSRRLTRFSWTTTTCCLCCTSLWTTRAKTAKVSGECHCGFRGQPDKTDALLHVVFGATQWFQGGTAEVSTLSSLQMLFSDATGSRDGATPPQDTSPHEVPPTGWAALGLTYKVQWPLHILFTPAVLEKCALTLPHAGESCVCGAAGQPPFLFVSLLCTQVQRCVQVPAERAARAVTAAALLGPADAEETPQVHSDGCC